MSQTATPDVGDLFQDAHDAGDISGQSLQVVMNLGATIQGALGTPAADVDAAEVMLFDMLVDNTVSMQPNWDVTIDGANLCIDSLLQSKQTNSILASIRYFDSVQNPFTGLADVEKLDRTNYVPSMGHTPLFDGALELLATTAAKSQEFASNGVPVRAVTVIVTDGGDNASKHTAAEVRSVAQDLLRSEAHIVAGVGINDGWGTDFKAVFSEMGIPDNWILTPGNNEHEIRQAFMVVSQSAVKVSQTANFSRSTLGGFGTAGYL